MLTLNHHESYIASLADTGHQFDVITQYKKLPLPWPDHVRETPANLNLIHWSDSVKNKIEEGYYDILLLHTLRNVLWFFKYRKTPIIFVIHIPLFFHNPWIGLKSLFKKCILVFARLYHRNFKVVAVSDFKRRSWFPKQSEDTDVIVLAPNKMPPCQTSANPKVVIVGNQINFPHRRVEMGFEQIMRVAAKIDLTAIGKNPGLSFNYQPSSYQDFLRKFSEFQIFLYTIRQPYGDGYNTAMLEAMSMGMAIVTVKNPSSPIIHDLNGLVVDSDDDIIKAIQFLKENPNRASELGNAARQTITDEFSHEKFIRKWKKCFERVAPLKT